MNTKIGERLSLKEKLGFGTYSCTFNLIYYFKASYYLFFLTNVLGIGVAAAGSVVAVGAVWDAINDPLIGYYTVNHPNKRGEHIRGLIPLAIIPTCICLILLFTNFHVSDRAALIISSIVFFCYDACLTCLGIVYCTMNTVATNNQGERTSININRSVGACLGSVIGTLACFPIMSALGAMDESGNLIAENADRGFFIVACIFSVIIVVGALVHYFTTKERVRPTKEEQAVGFFNMLKTLFSYKPFVKLTLILMLDGITLLFMTTVVVYYATYVTGSTEMSTYFQGACILCQILCTVFLVKAVVNRIGHTRTLLLGLTIDAVSKIPFVLFPSSTVAAFINFGLYGIGSGFVFVAVNVFISNVCDLFEWKKGKRMDASVGSISSFVCTIAAAVVTEILALSLAATGFDAELAVQPSNAIRTINIMLGIAPLILSVITLFFAKRFDIEKDMEQMKLDYAANRDEEK